VHSSALAGAAIKANHMTQVLGTQINRSRASKSETEQAPTADPIDPHSDVGHVNPTVTDRDHGVNLGVYPSDPNGDGLGLMLDRLGAEWPRG
jgi:hypothetical protein